MRAIVPAALRRAWSAEITPWRPSVIRFDLPFALVCTTYTFDPEGYTLTPKPGSSRSQNMASLSSTASRGASLIASLSWIFVCT